jgi:hypothetical protein
VQDALRELGHVLSLPVSAYIWLRYSDYKRSEWMPGAETTERARNNLWQFFDDIDGLAVGVVH